LNCEICGRKTDKLHDAIIAGIKLKVCSECSSLGTIIKPSINIQRKLPVKPIKITHNIKPTPIIAYRIVDNYHLLIKKARETMGLSQDILASYLGEKVSVIKKIEAGKLKPTLDLAKKIEKLLKVNIIEEESVEETNLK